MPALRQFAAPVALAAIIFAQPCGTASDIYNRLKSSHDALIAQERDIQRNYEEVTKQIDDLRQKQTLLDSYLTQTHTAIRDVERAMENTQ